MPGGRAVAIPKAAEGHQACEGARVANDEGARIEVLKALRSDMEATKVLNRVESVSYTHLTLPTILRV